MVILIGTPQGPVKTPSLQIPYRSLERTLKDPLMEPKKEP